MSMARKNGNRREYYHRSSWPTREEALERLQRNKERYPWAEFEVETYPHNGWGGKTRYRVRWVQRPMVCGECGSMFVPLRPIQQYCSKVCQKLIWGRFGDQRRYWNENPHRRNYMRKYSIELRKRRIAEGKCTRCGKINDNFGGTKCSRCEIMR